jgi:hypothetical protein
MVRQADYFHVYPDGRPASGAALVLEVRLLGPVHNDLALRHDVLM